MNFHLVNLLTFPAPLLIGIVSIFRRTSSRRFADFHTLLVFLAYAPLAEIVLQSFVVHRIGVDPSLLAIDRALHFPTLAIWHWIYVHHSLYSAAAAIYLVLPNVVALAWIFEQNTTTRTAWLIGGLMCFVGFALFPAVGPAHYDWAAHSALPAPRNCLPSMHMTWALLIAIMARDRRLKFAFWIFAALTGFATIAIGEHYLIDLVVSVPFTFAIRSSAEWIESRSIYPKRLLSPGTVGVPTP